MTDRPYINDIKQIQVERGIYKLAYKLTYEETEQLKELDFWKAKIIKRGFPPVEVHENPRGIPHSKKDDIITKLVPLMPKSRRQFWEKLAVSDVNDLITDHDNEED